MPKQPIISIVIPTLNSSIYIKTLLKSIEMQRYPNVEVILVDNGSTDETLIIGKKYKAKIIICKGNPPQVSTQRNLGAMVAKGKYLYFIDHDMELSKDFLMQFYKKVNTPKYSNVDAWYIPEKIISKSKILSIARNFEAKFVNGTVVSAVRIIKRKKFLLIKGFDEKLSGGPADWDLDIQLKLKNFKFAIFGNFVYHHEENLSVWSYIFKKTTYIKGEEAYKKKWRENKKVYNDIIVKQYNLRYRVFWIFVENKKWKKLIKNLHQYIIFLIIKLSMVAVYVYWRKKYVK